MVEVSIKIQKLKSISFEPVSKSKVVSFQFDNYYLDKRGFRVGSKLRMDVTHTPSSLQACQR